jgi:fatty-acyl-CoA synthase
MSSEPGTAGWPARALRQIGRLDNEAHYVGYCFRSGMLGLESPGRLLRLAKAYWDYGMLGGVIAGAAVRFPDRTAVIDDRGSVDYRELDRQVNAIANAWRAAGLQAGDGVAIMTRNHRGFLQALFAGAKCGARVILMNTGFSAPQVCEVITREGADLVVYDEEFEPLLAELPQPLRLGRYRAWVDTRPDQPDTLTALIASTAPSPAPPKPAHAPRLVIMTSGTTGTPKGAGRDVPVSLSPVGGPLSIVPFRSGDITQISAPLFHALGFTQGLLQIGLGATLVLQRRFGSLEALESLARNRVTSWIVVPVMLQRVLSLPAPELEQRDLSALRIIYMSGSQLGVDLARRATAAFGPVLYNLYGSTEIAYATIATPEDLAAEPGCVGRVVRGAVVKILDYTGGGDKERIGGLVSSGDVGHFDKMGRLFIDGRDDEMIISGGENVYPGEIEELLHLHPDVVEAAAVGVDDNHFGQRLTAFVVLRDGATLTEEDVKEYVRRNLARYKAPREVVFLKELPRNATGKILKRELAGR